MTTTDMAHEFDRDARAAGRDWAERERDALVEEGPALWRRLTRHPGPTDAYRVAGIYAIAVSAIAMVSPLDPVVSALYEGVRE